MTQTWTRRELKDRGKEKMRNFYWQAVLVCLIASLLGAGTYSKSFSSGRTASGDTRVSVGGSPGVTLSYNQDDRVKIDTPVYHASIPIDRRLGVMIISMVLMVFAVVLVVGILVSNVVQVGKKRYFLKKLHGLDETGIGELFSGFREGYWNLLLVMFLQKLFVFLWTLLLIVPGIVKTYEYYMIPYLLAENPYLSWEEAREKSCQMMDGHKFDVFVLEWSFIGWDLLGVLMCGIGNLFVAPYKEAVYGELYRYCSGRSAHWLR